MDTIQLKNRLFLSRHHSIASIVPFHKAMYDGLNQDDLIKAFVRNMSIALVTENFDEYEKHLDYMFATFSQNGIIRTDISLKIFNKCTHLRSINPSL